MPSVLGRGAVRSRVVVTLRRGSRLRRDDSGAGRSSRVDRGELHLLQTRSAGTIKRCLDIGW